MENKLNHFDQKGNAVMVDVSGKIPTSRTAVAKGKICVCQAVMDAVKQGTVKKGDVLGIARVAGIMAVKQTPSRKVSPLILISQSKIYHTSFDHFYKIIHRTIFQRNFRVINHNLPLVLLKSHKTTF